MLESKNGSWKADFEVPRETSKANACNDISLLAGPKQLLTGCETASVMLRSRTRAARNANCKDLADALVELALGCGPAVHAIQHGGDHLLRGDVRLRVFGEYRAYTPNDDSSGSIL